MDLSELAMDELYIAAVAVKETMATGDADSPLLVAQALYDRGQSVENIVGAGLPAPTRVDQPSEIALRILGGLGRGRGSDGASGY